MSYGLYVHCLFSECKRVKHHMVEEYYPSISKVEDSKRIQGSKGKQKFLQPLRPSGSKRWIAGIDERRHNLLKVFVLNSFT